MSKFPALDQRPKQTQHRLGERFSGIRINVTPQSIRQYFQCEYLNLAGNIG